MGGDNQDNMASTQVGEASVKLKLDSGQFTAEVAKSTTVLDTKLAKAARAAEKAFDGVGSTMAQAFGDVTHKAINKTTSLIQGGLVASVGLFVAKLDKAISRVDTLNNAPIVFDAMGYSVEDVNAVMTDLDGYLSNLPTTLDGAVNQIQNLAASFGGIKEGEKYFKALNDAGLAFGASSEKIDSAILQLSQLSLTGPLDAQTWLSLQNSGFQPVFTALAKQSNTTVDKLKESFGKGDKTVKDFLDALVKLDTEGSGSLESLSSLAIKNTAGIKTAMLNAGNAITKSVADIINKMPDLPKAIIEAGRGIKSFLSGDIGLDEMSDKIVNLADNIIGAVGALLDKLYPLVTKIIATMITRLADAAANYLSNSENAQKLVNGFVQVFTAVATSAGKIIEALIPVIPVLISALVNEISKPENAGHIAVALGVIVGGKGLLKLMSNAGHSLGGALMDKLTKRVGSSAKAIGPEIEKSKGGISKAVSGIFTDIGRVISSALNMLKEILVSAVQTLIEPIKTLLTGIGQAIAGFIKAFADPQVLFGALGFAAAAASIAVAILAIGGAIGVVTPALEALFNSVLKPLGEFLINSLVTIIQTVADVVVTVTANAINPLIETLAGAFSTVLNSVKGIIEAVAGAIAGVLSAALNGIKGIINAVGNAFSAMGSAIKTALDGVSGVINAFAGLISSIGAAAVAIIAVFNGRSINYGQGYAHVFAEGGLVKGAGTGTSDSIPARLSNGEYVIRAAAVKALGVDTLDLLNEAGNNTSRIGSLVPTTTIDPENTFGASGNVFNIVMNNNINNEMDAEDIGRKMMTSIRRAVA